MTISTEDIDDDLRDRLHRLRQERGVSLDRIVNVMIRIGLNSLEALSVRREPFKTLVFKGGEPLYKSPEDLKELIAQLDEEEVKRKLGLK